MKTIISVEDKKKFIRWILNNKEMKRRECLWILSYILNHSNLLANVHFVEYVHRARRGMVISTTDTDTENASFRFYNGNTMTFDTEKAFHDLKNNPDEKMFIQINFTDKIQNQEYLAVLENIDVMGKLINKEGGSGVSEDIERLVSEITTLNNRVSLMNEIDKALDNEDKELFMRLAGMLNDHEESKVVSFSA